MDLRKFSSLPSIEVADDESSSAAVLDDIKVTNCTHDAVSLRWQELTGQNTYVIEERDAFGIGRVFVGHSTECTLRGLEPLSQHEYRLKVQTEQGTLTSGWKNAFTTKEPVGVDHLIRACRAADTYRLNVLLKELGDKGSNKKLQILNSMDAKGHTALMECAIDDFADGAAILIEHNCDVNIQNYDGKCALTIAAQHGHTQMVNLLLMNGANLACRDRSDSNLLFSATDHAGVLRIVLREKVIDVNERNSSGWTPLHKVASVNLTESATSCTSLLLRAGADPNAKDANMNTPLCLAVIQSNYDACKVLLDHGADPLIVNENGNSPLKLAEALQNSKGASSRSVTSLFQSVLGGF